MCATRRVGRPVKPPLTPIPVGGPFDSMGVDVIRFPKSYLGNQYAVVFVDYLTKWPEVFPTEDQTALTIARLLVEKIIPRHGVPYELLSDRGAAFLSGLMMDVCELMGIHKVNTTAYHPQTDGLVEHFNRTLTDMLAKTVDKSGRDWDTRLPYIMFAYRTSMQESTRESPFYLMYGRDPQLPTESALTVPRARELIDLDSYKSEMVCSLADAWKLAQDNVLKRGKGAPMIELPGHRDLLLVTECSCICRQLSAIKRTSSLSHFTPPTVWFNCMTTALNFDQWTTRGLPLSELPRTDYVPAQLSYSKRLLLLLPSVPLIPMPPWTLHLSLISRSRSRLGIDVLLGSGLIDCDQRRTLSGATVIRTGKCSE